MKIGILTLPLNINYGGILQAYALQTILERMGHDVKVINFPYCAKPNTAHKIIGILKQFLKYILGGSQSIKLKWWKEIEETAIVQQHTVSFIHKYVHSRFITNLFCIGEYEFDTIIVGSDQIWRKKYINQIGYSVEDSFLSFTNGWNIKRISYAASFGIDNIFDYNEDEIRSCIEQLKKFDAISVREFTGIDICKKQFGINVCQMVDPTLLLSAEEYERLLNLPSPSRTNKKLFKYVLDEDLSTTSIIEDISYKLCLRTVKVNGSKHKNASLSEKIQQPVEKWIESLRDSEAVITDSFHACVFSLIFNKPFLVIGNKNRGISRFSSLLRMFDQEDRLVFCAAELPLKLEQLGRIPDCLSKIEERKEEAFAFLKSI